MSQINTKLLLILSIISSILCIISSIYIVNKNTKSTVFINTSKVFNDFHMTQELKAKGEKKIVLQQKKIDSIYALLNTNGTELEKQKLTQNLIQERDALDNFSSNYINAESAKIWTRINIYLSDFSKENGYDIVLGQQSNANVLYGSEEKNITNDFLIYINQHYEGNN